MKKLNFFRIFSFLLCFWIIFSSSGRSTDGLNEGTDSYQYGLRGLQLYQNEEYFQAAPLLRQALIGGHLSFALTYGDICLRNLDNGNHTKEEAAEWYIKGAEAGDGEALSYLQELSTMLVEEEGSLESKKAELVKIWTMQELVLDANKGFELYIAGDFANSAEFLQRASHGYHPLAQQLYADICLRELDGKHHPLKEAAMWYLLSAYGHDPQSFSYLVSIVPNIFANQDYNAQMEAIVKKWVYDVTISDLPKISPEHINNFLVFKYDRKIDKTTAQKLPYFFDKLVNALICNVGSRTQTVIEEEVVPVLEGDSSLPHSSPVMEKACAFEFEKLEGRLFANQSVACFSFGPVYFRYFTSLDSVLGSAKGKCLPKPAKVPDIPLVYEFILTSIQEATKTLKAKQLSRLSHIEYPWLLAGIRFWQAAYPHTSLNLTRLSDGRAINILTQMTEEVSEEDITEILNLVEDENIWPNNKDHPVSRQFSENVRKFFTSPISIESNLVQQAQAHFFRLLQSLTLDCKVKHDLQILQTPLFMFHCEILVLNDLASNQSCYNALSQGQRYFVHLAHLTINYSSNFKGTNDSGKKITTLIQEISKRGFEVIEATV